MGSNEIEAPPDPTPSPLPKRSWTRRRTAFDATFGLLLPAFCVYADPGVLRGDAMLGPSALSGHTVAAYAAIALGMVVLCAWLPWRRGAVYLAGPLLASGIAALAIGIGLLPASLPALLVVIGVLGLVPFATAYVFVRNAAYALGQIRASRAPAAAWTISLVFGVAALALPLAAQTFVDHRVDAALDAALHPDARREAEAVDRLKPYGRLIDNSAFLAAWRSTKDPDRRERLERVWLAATGDGLGDGD